MREQSPCCARCPPPICLVKRAVRRATSEQIEVMRLKTWLLALGAQQAERKRLAAPIIEAVMMRQSPLPTR